MLHSCHLFITGSLDPLTTSWPTLYWKDLCTLVHCCLLKGSLPFPLHELKLGASPLVTHACLSPGTSCPRNEGLDIRPVLFLNSLSLSLRGEESVSPLQALELQVSEHSLSWDSGTTDFYFQKKLNLAFMGPHIHCHGGPHSVTHLP